MQPEMKFDVERTKRQDLMKLNFKPRAVKDSFLNGMDEWQFFHSRKLDPVFILTEPPQYRTLSISIPFFNYIEYVRIPTPYIHHILVRKIGHWHKYSVVLHVLKSQKGVLRNAISARCLGNMSFSGVVCLGGEIFADIKNEDDKALVELIHDNYWNKAITSDYLDGAFADQMMKNLAYLNGMEDTPTFSSTLKKHERYIDIMQYWETLSMSKFMRIPWFTDLRAKKAKKP